MYKRILLPTDGSDATQRAVMAGVQLAKAVGAEVVAMTATPEFHPVTTDPTMLTQTEPEHRQAGKEQGQQLLDDVAAVAREKGVPCTAVQVESDNPYEAIISSARAQQCDLIVMASHGRRGIKGLLLGSETQKVLVHSAIPVMVHR
jgi:nucleotide-binding universal stress UspA family protein